MNFKIRHTNELLKDPFSTTNLNDLPGRTNKNSLLESGKNLNEEINKAENSVRFTKLFV